MAQERLEVRTEGRGSIDITERIQAVVGASGVEAGLCNLFIEPHERLVDDHRERGPGGAA